MPITRGSRRLVAAGPMLCLAPIGTALLATPAGAATRC